MVLFWEKNLLDNRIERFTDELENMSLGPVYENELSSSFLKKKDRVRKVGMNIRIYRRNKIKIRNVVRTGW